MTQKFLIHQSEPRGMALVLCLLLITTLCLIGGAALSISGLNHRIVHNGTKQRKAFYVAEAGRESALAQLNADPMWRGGEVPASGVFEGGISIDGVGGLYQISLSDCTADENGIYNELLPADHVMLKSAGTWIDAMQTVSCIVRITPEEGTAATFPQVVVLSSGTVTGDPTILDDLGDEDGSLLLASAELPEANAKGLKAIADMAFSDLDDDAWDAALYDDDSFWRDPPANIHPRILYVQGDLEISGERQLYGIVFVEGKDVVLDDDSGVEGILYAPNATSVSVQNTGPSGRIVVLGQMITGSGGVTVTGNQASFRHDPDYVDAFNIAAASEVKIDVVPGSWGMR